MNARAEMIEAQDDYEHWLGSLPDDHEQWLYSILDRLDLARRDGYLTNDEFHAVEVEFELTWRY